MKRNWFITGISSGFGREMAKQLLAKGDVVAGTVRTINSVEDLKSLYGDRLRIYRLEVTETPEIKTVVNQAFHDLGKIEVVVNNAGYGLFGAADELRDEDILHQLNTNLLGSIQVVRAALPHLRQQGAGRILQISSYGGQVATPGGSLYNASKWGIEGFMEALSQEVAPFNIGVTIVEPGGARTSFRRESSKVAQPMTAYDGTPASRVRGIKEMPLSLGDPAKMVEQMILSVERAPAPLRLVLGSDAQSYIHAALTKRLAENETQKTSASYSDIGK